MLSGISITRDIDKILSSGKPLSGEDKDKISKFVGDKKLENNND